MADRINKLFDADGDSVEVVADGAVAYEFHVELPSSGGTMGSGTVTVMVRKHADSDWQALDSTNLAFSAVGTRIFYVAHKTNIKLTLSGATSPSLRAYLTPVPALSR